MGFHDRELSVLFTDDKRISRLNQRYLGKIGSTNVLAFPMAEGPVVSNEMSILGDVVVSVDTAIRESKALGEPLERTVDRLLVHGILHLRGYDHERSTAEANRMGREEKRILKLITEE